MSQKNIKIGLIGVGSRGVLCFGDYINKYEGAEITALCDVNTVRMEESAKKLKGEQKMYTTPEAMFKAEKLDAVIITSPDYCHEEHAVAALKNGVNVLIDKPLATTVKGCENIITTAEKAGKTVMIGFNLRHDPTLKRLKQIIDDGVLGKVFLIENREFYNGGRTYMARWNRKYECSGGLWIHKGSHDFDVFQWLMDFPKPVKVSATAGVNILDKDHLPFKLQPGVKAGPTCHECAYKDVCPDVCLYDSYEEWGDRAVKEDGYTKDLCIYLSDKSVHDNGIAIVEYDNGARASHLECFVTPISDRMYTVVGDKGQAEVSLHKRKITVHPRWSEESIVYNIPEAKGGHGGADTGLFNTFIKVIRGSQGNASTAEHGMWSTAVGEAAELAWRENRTVQVSELFKRGKK